MATNKSTKRAAIYARVSTDDQTTENQLRELRQVAERCGWEVVAEFVDNGISGARAATNAQPSMRSSEPLHGAKSMWLWHGASTGSVAACNTW